MSSSRAFRSFLLIGLGVLLAGTAQADVLSWESSSGVLPSDASIPVDQRFELSGTASYASISGGPLVINDSADVPTISFGRDEAFGADWTYEIDLKMIALQRALGWLQFGSVTAVSDGTRRVILGVGIDEVGLVDTPSRDWVDDQSVNPATTDGFHTYRVVKSGATVELFIDGSASASLSIPYSSFPATANARATLTGTSSIGTAHFEVSRFEVNTAVTAVPALSPLWLAMLATALLLGHRRAT